MFTDDAVEHVLTLSFWEVHLDWLDIVTGEDVPLLPYTIAVVAANLVVTTGVCILGAPQLAMSARTVALAFAYVHPKCEVRSR